MQNFLWGCAVLRLLINLIYFISILAALLKVLLPFFLILGKFIDKSCKLISCVLLVFIKVVLAESKCCQSLSLLQLNGAPLCLISAPIEFAELGLFQNRLKHFKLLLGSLSQLSELDQLLFSDGNLISQRLNNIGLLPL